MRQVRIVTETPVQLDPALTEAALEIARELTRAGIPVFAAPPDDSPIGFRLPYRWQQIEPDPARVDAWQPGWALCAVMGRGLDLVDLDLYAGADMPALDGLMPHAYGGASTASGGLHLFVASMGVRSKNALFKGIDIKAGDEKGRGRGFAFIAPTVKTSKATGQPGTYYWVTPPDLAALAAQGGQDTTGQPLAAVMAAKQPGAGAPPNGDSPSPMQQFLRQKTGPGPWADPAATLKEHGRNNGTMKLACSLRERDAMDADTAVEYMREHAWPHVDQGQGGHEFSWEEFESVVRAVWREYPGPAEAVQQAAALPDIPVGGVDLTDAYLVDRVACYVLGGRFAWASGLGWLRWNGTHWEAVTDEAVHDAVRGYFIWLHGEAARSGADHTLLARLSSLLSRARITAVTVLSRGHPQVYCKAAGFDAHPDLLNTPGGVVDLRTGEVSEHDPALRLTRITKGSYKPGYTHPDWKQALTALDEEEHTWYQDRIGQAVTGHPPSDGIMPVLQGPGSNGKTLLTTDGPVIAFGDYARVASPKLIMSQQPGRSEHSTEMADLRGQRLLVGEELTEGRSIDVTTLKRIQDVGMITARYVHKDNMTFPPSHTLLVTTNYIPVIAETDHGTWRRLALVRFRRTFRKPGEALSGPHDQHGDPELKHRIRRGQDGQHDAIVTWAVEGAIRWYAAKMTDASPTRQIRDDTRAWRATADFVLSFWQEFLIEDHGTPGSHVPCISASHLLEVFNTRQAQNGHNAWSKELFASRFAENEMTTQSHVEYRVTAMLDNLSWHAGTGLYGGSRAVARQMRVWAGVRFRNPDDQPVDEVDDLEVKPDGVLTQGTFAGGSSTSSSGGPEPAPAAPAPGTGGAIGTAPEKFAEGSSTPATPVTPEPGSPPGTEITESKPKRERKPKAAKREGPDPELAGPVLSLPAVTGRTGVIVPCPPDQAAVMIGSLGPELTVDVETTGYSLGHPDYALRTVQLGNDQLAAVFDAADPASREVIRASLAAARILHAHSAVADLVPLADAGLCGEDAWNRMQDTVLPAKLADPAMSGSDADGLKQLAADVLGDYAVIPAANEARKDLFASGKWLTDTDALTPPARSGWAQVDSRCETMIRYAASDVLDTAALPRALPPVPDWILARERAVQAVCARVSHRGLRLDPDHVRALTDSHRAAKAKLGQAIGGDYEITNPGSAQQVAAAFSLLGTELPRTKPSRKFPQGQPSTAESVLTPLRRAGGEAGELASAILDYRSHATVLSLILEPFRVQVDRGDGRVRPTVYTLGADTGRMSCVRPNLQQLSRTGGIRACITADPGMVLISADFQAVELRTAAALSGDADLYRMILDGDDLHWKIARQVWGPDASKADRYNAKRGVFGRLYGSGIPGIAKTLGISEAEAQAVADTLDALAPGVARWSAGLQKYVRDGGTSITAHSGRVIWLDRQYPHKAANYAIQGSAREFLVDGLLNWRQSPWGGCTVLPVHDEVLAVVPAAEAAAATAALVACMQTELAGMPIVAEPSEPSFAWQDAS
jgi:P4 family phage/plasmid primase-like protien